MTSFEHWLVELAGSFGGRGDLRVVPSSSGALIAYLGPVVVKIHHPRTGVHGLQVRLQAAADPTLTDLLVTPLSSSVHRSPDDQLATVWPHVEVLRAEDDPPWAAVGALLARLHHSRAQAIAALPELYPTARLERALRHAQRTPYASLLDAAGCAVLRQITATTHRQLVHGDWHLGQVGRAPDGELRLLDIDDLGVGDPAWDLARPAGFWAAGLLDDRDWDDLLTAYRRADGPAVPPDGDPWPRLELPARAAVVAAACRMITRPRPGEGEAAEALLEACARM